MRPIRSTNGQTLPLLESGDRMSQAEFHRRYSAYPDNVKVELIGGIVYFASPSRRNHATRRVQLGGLFWLYSAPTHGIEALKNATTILGEESEPQPELSLRIDAERGGQSGTNSDEYVVGPPELLAEIAHSNRSLALHNKRNDYKSSDVREYLVVCLEEQEIHWFDFKAKRVIRPDEKGIFRSKVFPGLWIDGPALLAGKIEKTIRVLKKGLADKSHAAFCKRLERQRPPN